MKTCKTLMLATVFSFAVASVWSAGIALAAVDSFLEFPAPPPPPPPPPPKATIKSSPGSSAIKGAQKVCRGRGRPPQATAAAGWQPPQIIPPKPRRNDDTIKHGVNVYLSR